MQFLKPSPHSPLTLRLARDLVRSLKRGHPWVFAEALRQHPNAPAGTPAILLDSKKGREVARGFYEPNHPIAFRVGSVEPNEALNDRWAEQRFWRALKLRQSLFNEATTGFRLFHGEGDGLPGLICDIYGEMAVLQLDGAGPAGFWQPEGIARWLVEQGVVRRVYEKYQARAGGEGRPLVGPAPERPVSFRENGLYFTADVVQGQKTGFFLDQRENRQRIKPLAAGRRVLNMFGYTGGFSVYAGQGGATHVTTVDLAEPALQMAEQHWQLNNLPLDRHRTVKAEAFQFLEKADKNEERWELVILDPPSFAASKETVPQALKAYQKLIALGAAVTTPGGLLAAASCSSHIGPTTFLTVCEEAISRARRRATLLGLYDQPADHPTPLAFAEFRYLKFVLMQLV